MKKVLWVSNHNYSPFHIQWLESIYGLSVSLEKYPEFIKNTADKKQINRIKKHFNDGKFNDLVIIGPPFLIETFCREGFEPFTVESRRESNPKMIDYRDKKGQGFREIGFRKETKKSFKKNVSI